MSGRHRADPRPPDGDAAIQMARRLIAAPSVDVGWHGRIRVVARGSRPSDRFHAAVNAPAYRWTARMARVAIGLRLVLAQTAHDATPDGVDLAAWLPRSLAGLTPRLAIVGTPGPEQTILVHLVDHLRRPRAVLKVAVDGAARGVQREIDALREPSLAGKVPPLLHAGTLEHRDAFVAGYVAGTPGRTDGRGIDQALRALPDPTPAAPWHALASHPWIAKLASQGRDVSRLDRALPARYPVVRLHGDFAPWNLRIQRDGRVLAIDWEASQRDGFPGIDLAHHVVVTERLIRRRRPGKAAEAAAAVLRRRCGYPPARAWATVALMAEDMRGHDEVDASALTYWREVGTRALEQADPAG